MAGKFEGPVGWDKPHPDDEITVYHTTTPEQAEILRRQGTAGPKPTKPPTRVEDERLATALGKKVGEPYDFEPGRGMGPGLYVTRHPGQGTLYGTHTLPVRVRFGDMASPPERPRLDPWRALNVEDGYIPGHLSPHQFGDVYTRDDWREWNNHHG